MPTKQVRLIETVSVTTFKKRTKPKKHYVFEVQISWSDSSEFYIYRGYEDFCTFHTRLLKLFSNKGKIFRKGVKLPKLPNKIMFGRSHIAKVAKARLDAINKYCQALIRLPKHISESPHVLSFFTALPGDIKIPQQNLSKAQSWYPLIIPAGCAWDSYMASSDFEGDSKNTQLTLKTGDSVQVICKDESGWWMATDGESTGWVPSDFLQPVSESTTSDSSGEEDNDDVIGLNIPGGRVIHTEEYLAIDNYEAEDDSQVSFKEGCLITVVDKEEDGWWFVCADGREGWAPSSFLEPVSAQDKSDMDSSEDSEDDLELIGMDLTKYGHLASFVTTKTYMANEPDELTVPYNTHVQVVRKSTTGWWTIKYDEKVGLFPARCLTEVRTGCKRRNFYGQRLSIPSIYVEDTEENSADGQAWERRTNCDSTLPPLSPDEDSSPLRSPALPPRPCPMLVHQVLSRTPSPYLSPGPAFSYIHHQASSKGHEQVQYDPSQYSSRRSSLASITSSSLFYSTPSTVHANDTSLTDALLKIILQFGNQEMKAHLADIMIDNPALAEWMKAAKYGTL